jgi:DNA-binding MarR family transcriptional regulator
MTQSEILTLLKSSPGKRWKSRELSQATGTHKGKIAGMASQLYRFGFIEREHNPERNEYYWMWNPKGKRKVKQ